MMNTYKTGGKVMVGNWYEERFEGKQPAKRASSARKVEPELKTGRIKRVPRPSTAERIMAKPTRPVYETETRTTLRRHHQLAPLPSKKMLQLENFEHMNQTRKLPPAPKYGFGAHFPRHYPPKVSAMASTQHTAYGGRYAERAFDEPLQSNYVRPTEPQTRSLEGASQYTSSFNLHSRAIKSYGRFPYRK
mmetsp:Transcript_4123/g.8227  ORF Transcript_4123/g.8227 Transcript_4123/m.8227 type:complete len:190 (-) Transcript_4123:383-952(-)